MAEVAVVDAAQENVEVEALDGHPGEAAEQRAVQDGAQARAQRPGHARPRQQRAEQEGRVQEQHRAVQVQVDARQGLVLLPAGASTVLRGLGTPRAVPPSELTATNLRRSPPTSNPWKKASGVCAAAGNRGDHLVWKCSSAVSSAVTMEMLQPTMVM